MLPHLLSASLVKNNEKKTVCILVATSGDTGKAALEGFKDVKGTKILVFYPKDGVSKVQELADGTPRRAATSACAPCHGNFDDAQTGVKALFSDERLRDDLAKRGYFLSSANSINWGRILPQLVYYISAYCDLLNLGKIQMGEKVNFCVPTGNFGNILAGWYARSDGSARGQAHLRLQQQQRADRLPALPAPTTATAPSTPPCLPPWTSWSPAIWSACSLPCPARTTSWWRDYMQQLNKHRQL